ncbi:MAG: nitroreductase family deazaflavin-dependent oxidoreductase [Chloroflexi bacterium]|nr:nitroreductase family deazaflavin-dependent oxidoreductase [Chloroflexota bacterium]
MTTDLSHLASEAFCYLTTTGRVSGRPHTIEIWFALNQQTLYMLSGGMERSDWVKNAWRQPNVTVKIKDMVFAGKARPVKDTAEDALARQLIGAKYHESEDDLDEWLKSALPVAVDLLV